MASFKGKEDSNPGACETLLHKRLGHNSSSPAKGGGRSRIFWNHVVFQDSPSTSLRVVSMSNHRPRDAQHRSSCQRSRRPRRKMTWFSHYDTVSKRRGMIRESFPFLMNKMRSWGKVDPRVLKRLVDCRYAHVRAMEGAKTSSSLSSS
jgi:hypothetical protein